MAGIYIHIPFCKTRCIYCNFYSTTRGEYVDRYVRALCSEMQMRCGEDGSNDVKTIYIGGGTPSQLSSHNLELIFSTLDRLFCISQCEEITIEANPDDLTDDYVSMLRTLPVNRISMGVQTFNDRKLHFLNRRHDAAEAIAAVERCRKAGFDNISIDLIYGLPGETTVEWQNDLRTATALGVEHLSAYSLTYEEGTPIYNMVSRHDIEPVDEEVSLAFFGMLRDELINVGYQHYEISNFCKPGHPAVHNSSYWHGVPYLGLGAAAHSYNGSTRREWNVASLTKYVENMEAGKRDYGFEELDEQTQYNEFVMTGLRTSQGISLNELSARFGTELYDYCLDMSKQYLSSGKMLIDGDRLHLTPAGIFISDAIVSDLMRV